MNNRPYAAELYKQYGELNDAERPNFRLAFTALSPKERQVILDYQTNYDLIRLEQSFRKWQQVQPQINFAPYLNLINQTLLQRQRITNDHHLTPEDLTKFAIAHINACTDLKTQIVKVRFPNAKFVSVEANSGNDKDTYPVVITAIEANNRQIKIKINKEIAEAYARAAMANEISKNSRNHFIAEIDQRLSMASKASEENLLRSDAKNLALLHRALVCTLTGKLFEEPVVLLADGHTYEKSKLIAMQFTERDFRPNVVIQNIVEKLRDSNIDFETTPYTDVAELVERELTDPITLEKCDEDVLMFPDSGAICTKSALVEIMNAQHQDLKKFGKFVYPSDLPKVKAPTTREEQPPSALINNPEINSIIRIINYQSLLPATPYRATELSQQRIMEQERQALNQLNQQRIREQQRAIELQQRMESMKTECKYKIKLVETYMPAKWKKYFKEENLTSANPNRNQHTESIPARDKTTRALEKFRLRIIDQMEQIETGNANIQLITVNLISALNELVAATKPSLVSRLFANDPVHRQMKVFLDELKRSEELRAMPIIRRP